MASIKSGLVTVTTAGTAVPFPSADKRAISLILMADEPNNTGRIYIGDSDVSSTSGWILIDATNTNGRLTGNEFPIPTGQSIILSDVWLDSAVNGDSVRFLAVLE